jgi:hypothetical protein
MFGYALIGLWLSGLNYSALRNSSWPRRLVQCGLVIGIFMTVGLLTSPGILGGVDAMDSAPWHVNSDGAAQPRARPTRAPPPLLRNAAISRRIAAFSFLRPAVEPTTRGLLARIDPRSYSGLRDSSPSCDHSALRLHADQVIEVRPRRKHCRSLAGGVLSSGDRIRLFQAANCSDLVSFLSQCPRRRTKPRSNEVGNHARALRSRRAGPGDGDL